MCYLEHIPFDARQPHLSHQTLKVIGVGKTMDGDLQCLPLEFFN